jgi:hypothetical protein
MRKRLPDSQNSIMKRGRVCEKGSVIARGTVKAYIPPSKGFPPKGLRQQQVVA